MLSVYTLAESEKNSAMGAPEGPRSDIYQLTSRSHRTQRPSNDTAGILSEFLPSMADDSSLQWSLKKSLVETIFAHFVT